MVYVVCYDGADSLADIGYGSAITWDGFYGLTSGYIAAGTGDGVGAGVGAGAGAGVTYCTDSGISF